MKQVLKTFVQPVLRKLGVDVVRYREQETDSEKVTYLQDFGEQNLRICESVKPYTMTSPEKRNALIEAVKYIVANKIAGSFVECGVWKGGSAMAMALTLKELGTDSRDIYLYDTYAGMSAPTNVDINITGHRALDMLPGTKMSEFHSGWCVSPLEEVKENVFKTGYPRDKFHFIKGKVEDTIPDNLPGDIALLRLDTDWYESTKHELMHLFPLLSPFGVMIVDDYGHWKGQRKAVDEYIAEHKLCILLKPKRRSLRTASLRTSRREAKTNSTSRTQKAGLTPLRKRDSVPKSNFLSVEPAPEAFDG